MYLARFLRSCLGQITHSISIQLVFKMQGKLPYFINSKIYERKTLFNRKVIETTPTLGSNMEEVTHKNVKLKVWDLGGIQSILYFRFLEQLFQMISNSRIQKIGQKSIREVWDQYFLESDAVIYVVDSTDKSKEDESMEEFQKLLKNEQLKNAVFLIFANKQDLDDAMSADQIAEKYKLSDIKTHSWHIQNLFKNFNQKACSAVKNTGLGEGLDWVVDKILEKNK